MIVAVFDIWQYWYSFTFFTAITCRSQVQQRGGTTSELCCVHFAMSIAIIMNERIDLQLPCLMLLLFYRNRGEAVVMLTVI